jgi:hypothetical protein
MVMRTGPQPVAYPSLRLVLLTRGILRSFDPASSRFEGWDPLFPSLKKSGRGPPTAPTLRPRVLTPRDHFAHRGGERRRIMQQTD